MQWSTVAIEQHDAVVHVKLNRPRSANALDEAMWRELREAMQWCDVEPTVRAVVLERFPIFLNRLGFPNQLVSDSNCMLAKEAGMHVQAPLARSA